MEDAYVRFLTSHNQGRLGTIDISGFAMERSAKYRNVGRDPKVSFVIDDAIGEGAQGMRFWRSAVAPNRRASSSASTPGGW